MTRTERQELIERVAGEWAKMDGKYPDFINCKRNPEKENTQGYYRGYLEDAAHLLKMSGIIDGQEALKDTGR